MNSLSAITANTALIGHTGFVGSALLRQTSFTRGFNSANIAEIDGSAFDMVVCAAAPGSMLEANTAPERDLAQIEALIERLSTLRTRCFVLISSIAVLADFASGADETTSDFQQDLAYGRHRRMLEAFVEDHFENSLVVRMPALFGEGLRKNFLFDLLNPVPSMLRQDRFDALAGALDTQLSDAFASHYALDPATGMLKLDRAALNADPVRAALDEAVIALDASAVQFHNPETTYQYYAIERLWADIGLALDAGLSHLHLCAEPLKAADIHQHLTGRAMPETPARLHQEDMRTRHAELWGQTGPYQYDAAGTLAALTEFYTAQRGSA